MRIATIETNGSKVTVNGYAGQRGEGSLSIDVAAAPTIAVLLTPDAGERLELALRAIREARGNAARLEEAARFFLHPESNAGPAESLGWATCSQSDIGPTQPPPPPPPPAGKSRLADLLDAADVGALRARDLAELLTLVRQELGLKRRAIEQLSEREGDKP